MTEPQARAFMAQIQKEFPDKIIARLGRSQERQDERGFIVKLQFDGRIITVYKPDQWQEIKWVWGLEKADDKPVYHLVGLIPMILERRRNGYWYGRYRENGKNVQKYFGRSDPRSLYPVVEKEEAAVCSG